MSIFHNIFCFVSEGAFKLPNSVWLTKAMNKRCSILNAYGPGRLNQSGFVKKSMQELYNVLNKKASGDAF